jgi:hypothetical protein
MRYAYSLSMRLRIQPQHAATYTAVCVAAMARAARAGTQFTGFPSTKVQILTAEEVCVAASAAVLSRVDLSAAN